MKFFITGGCGFIGTNLAFSFNKKLQRYIILDNLSKTTAKFVNSEKKKFFVKIDLAKSKKLNI